MTKLRNDESYLTTVIASLESRTDSRSIAAYNENTKERMEVRHAITDLKPLKEKIGTLSDAHIRAVARRAKIQENIGEYRCGIGCTRRSKQFVHRR